MIDPAGALDLLTGARVFVTGASGSIGAAVVAQLRDAHVSVIPTDLGGQGFAIGHGYLDVRDGDSVRSLLRLSRATHVLHLAGAKHAPEGEIEPAETARTNIGGTENVLRHARGARVVTASTCKACDPETAYGASKLIAERMTLNAGGSVARFYNVPDSSGNVFRLWESLPEDEPLPVAPCARYFVSLDDAVALLLWAAVLDPGRYCIDPGKPIRMDAVARDLYPDRVQEPMPPRRGDRTNEPLKARSEWTNTTRVAGIWRVTGPHDVSASEYPLEEAIAG